MHHAALLIPVSETFQYFHHYSTHGAPSIVDSLLGASSVSSILDCKLPAKDPFYLS
jgi:hypothetical protein